QGYVPHPFWNRPDTRAVALSKLNAFNQTLDQRAGAMLRNPNFQHPGLLPRLTPAELQAEAAGRTGTIGPYRPDVGPGGLTAEQRPATPVREIPQPIPGAPTLMEGARTKALGDLGLQAPPSPTQNPGLFQRYLAASRKYIAQYRPDLTPQELDDVMRKIAQKLGGTWQPAVQR